MNNKLGKEVCNFCSRHINIGQKFGECESCSTIIHEKCYKKSEFKSMDNYKLYCKFCSYNDTAIKEFRYNPFSSYEKSEIDENEESEIIDSIGIINTILENCSTYNYIDFNNKINKFKAQCPQIFSSLFFNIDGNNTNFDNFISEIQCIDHKFSVIGLAETNSYCTNQNLYQIDGYNSCYQDKMNSKLKGSGVALYISKEYNFIENENLSMLTPDLETIFVTITNTPEPIIIGTVYRPPSGDKNKFLTKLTEILNLIPQNKKAYLMGDFNLDLLNIYGDAALVEYEELIITSGFSPLISIPTHDKPSCRKSCIDNIFANYFENVLLTGTFHNTLSYHHPVFQICRSGSTLEKENSYFTTEQHYDYSNSNVDKCSEIFAQKLPHIQSKLSEDCHKNFEILTEELQNSIDLSCKLDKPKTSKRNIRVNPWITPGLICSINKK